MMMDDSQVVGLEKGVVRLCPYKPQWKQIFEAEKSILAATLGSLILDIQHVGSTSIPGMPAKPIIDIAIAVPHYEEAHVCIPLVETLGYEYRGEFGIPRRHYFTKGDPRTFHLHMVELGSSQWQNLLFFRNHLCQHPQLAREYAVLKAGLAQKFPGDREAYLQGKAEFIQRVLQTANPSSGR